MPGELHNDSRNLAASSGIQRREGIEKSWSEETLQPLFLLCFSGKIKENRQDDRNCLNSSMVHHAARIGIRIQSVKSMPPTTENWLRKLYNYSMKNDTSIEDKHETNHINNEYNDLNMNTCKMHNT